MPHLPTESPSPALGGVCDCAVLASEEADAREETLRVAARLGLAWVSGDAAPTPPFFLECQAASGWRLRSRLPECPGELKLDFSRGPAAWRLRQAGRRQPLGRAFGLGPRAPSPHIVDATAGLGRDAMTLAAMGCRVTMIERHPVIAFLLEDAINRTAPEDLRKRVRIVHAQAGIALKNSDTPVDGIYLDPMYPERKKSALVKQEMRLLRALVGTDPDAAALLQTALESGAERVVVKRPRGAPPLPGPRPSHAIQAPNTRYDVYLNPARSRPHDDGARSIEE